MKRNREYIHSTNNGVYNKMSHLRHVRRNRVIKLSGHQELLPFSNRIEFSIQISTLANQLKFITTVSLFLYPPSHDICLHIIHIQQQNAFSMPILTIQVQIHLNK